MRLNTVYNGSRVLIVVDGCSPARELMLRVAGAAGSTKNLVLFNALQSRIQLHNTVQECFDNNDVVFARDSNDTLRNNSASLKYSYVMDENHMKSPNSLCDDNENQPSVDIDTTNETLDDSNEIQPTKPNGNLGPIGVNCNYIDANATFDHQKNINETSKSLQIDITNETLQTSDNLKCFNENNTMNQNDSMNTPSLNLSCCNENETSVQNVLLKEIPPFLISREDINDGESAIQNYDKKETQQPLVINSCNATVNIFQNDIKELSRNHVNRDVSITEIDTIIQNDKMKETEDTIVNINGINEHHTTFANQEHNIIENHPICVIPRVQQVEIICHPLLTLNPISIKDLSDTEMDIEDAAVKDKAMNSGDTEAKKTFDIESPVLGVEATNVAESDSVSSSSDSGTDSENEGELNINAKLISKIEPDHESNEAQEFSSEHDVGVRMKPRQFEFIKTKTLTTPPITPAMRFFSNGSKRRVASLDELATSLQKPIALQCDLISEEQLSEDSTSDSSSSSEDDNPNCKVARKSGVEKKKRSLLMMLAKETSMIAKSFSSDSKMKKLKSKHQFEKPPLKPDVINVSPKKIQGKILHTIMDLESRTAVEARSSSDSN